MKEDWRITNQANYLSHARLIKTVYKRTEKSDHEHCEFCWDKFGEENGLLHKGYCTPDKYWWICERCYEDFKNLFGWILI